MDKLEMMQNCRNLPILLLSLLIATGCNRFDQKENAEKDVESIKELQHTYLNAVRSGDLDQFMSVWADDAIRLESDFNYIIGKEKIREHFKPLFDLYNIKITLYGDIVHKIDGDLAYSHSNFLVSQNPKDADTVIHIDFKFLEIYERQDDGTWKIAVGSAFTNPQWSEETVPAELQDTSVPKL